MIADPGKLRKNEGGAELRHRPRKLGEVVCEAAASFLLGQATTLVGLKRQRLAVCLPIG